MSITKVFNDSTDLRDVLRPFFKTIEDEHGYMSIVAPKPQYIKVKNLVFTVGNGFKEIKDTKLTEKLCQVNKCSGSGFLVLLEKHELYLSKIGFAFQCDQCKLVYILNLPDPDYKKEKTKHV